MPQKAPDSNHWHQKSVFYQLHVRSFADGNNDGIGDFKGLLARLNYLERLGVDTLWLQPFYASPLRDDGYDISDYCSIHPDYGALKDFKNFLREARRREIRVNINLVLNHTSDQHPWFQRARHAPSGSKWRNFYVWSESPDKFANTRIIFKDIEDSNWTWDSVANAYYWHRFYMHQPDLNYDRPHVRREMLSVVNYCLNLGVAGFRLDAISYLFEREGTSYEVLPETHAFLEDREHEIYIVDFIGAAVIPLDGCCPKRSQLRDIAATIWFLLFIAEQGLAKYSLRHPAESRQIQSLSIPCYTYS